MKRPLLVATIVVCVVLASSPGAAVAELSPRDPGGLEYAAGPSDELRPDPSPEPVVSVAGSGAGSLLPGRPEPEPWGETDPWADAVVGIATPSFRVHLSPYPLVMNEQVRFFVDRFTGERREVVEQWMGRAGRYLGMIRDVLRRNGLPESDQASLVEHFLRHGKFLTHVSVVTDPIFLTEPFVRTQVFHLFTQEGQNWLYPCDSVVEIANRRILGVVFGRIT